MISGVLSFLRGLKQQQTSLYVKYLDFHQWVKYGLLCTEYSCGALVPAVLPDSTKTTNLEI